MKYNKFLPFDSREEEDYDEYSDEASDEIFTLDEQDGHELHGHNSKKGNDTNRLYIAS